MSQYDKVKEELRINPRTWLVTGVAGFIGSNLLRELLTLEQRVIGIDNFSTGHQANLNSIEELLEDIDNYIYKEKQYGSPYGNQTCDWS